MDVLRSGPSPLLTRGRIGSLAGLTTRCGSIADTLPPLVGVGGSWGGAVGGGGGALLPLQLPEPPPLPAPQEHSGGAAAAPATPAAAVGLVCFRVAETPPWPRPATPTVLPLEQVAPPPPPPLLHAQSLRLPSLSGVEPASGIDAAGAFTAAATPPPPLSLSSLPAPSTAAGASYWTPTAGVSVAPSPHTPSFYPSETDGGGVAVSLPSSTPSSPPSVPASKTRRPTDASRPYRCPYPGCHSASRYRSNAKAHARLHSTERPFVCRVAGCGKRFKWASSMSYHRRRHEVLGVGVGTMSRVEQTH